MLNIYYPIHSAASPEYLAHPASAADISWYKATPANRDVAPDVRMPTVRVCPGVQDAAKLGFIVPMPCDLEVIVHKEGDCIKFKAGFSNKEVIMGITAHSKAQFNEYRNADGADWENVKINTKIAATSDEKCSVLYIAPLYDKSDLFDVIPGVIDHSAQHQIHFHLRWKALTPGTYLIKAGTPMLQGIPVDGANTVDIEVKPADRAVYEQIATRYSKLLKRGDYRRRQRAVAAQCPYAKTKSVFSKFVGWLTGARV